MNSTVETETTEDRLARLLERLRCPGCGARLQADGRASLRCPGCGETFPIIDQIPRMVLKPLREAIEGRRTAEGDDARQAATAQSFGFEWGRFPEMRAEWERNFLEYQAPLGPEFFEGKVVLDAGSGSGRHAHYAALYGAEVWAIDLGTAVEVARRNTANMPNAQVVQADLYRPPFAPETFDYVYSLGVLHHLPDPEAGFLGLLRFLKPGGTIRIYLYWQSEGQPIKRALLGLTKGVRQVTTRLPHAWVHALAHPTAWLAFVLFVWPYRLLSQVGLGRLAERLPMTQYARYPYRVCVNDQLDRLSAPIENRYTRAEVEAWLRRAGLEDVDVRPYCGWIGTGRKPVAS